MARHSSRASEVSMKLVLLWWEGLARRSAGLWVVVKASVHTFPAVGVGGADIFGSGANEW